MAYLVLPYPIIQTTKIAADITITINEIEMRFLFYEKLNCCIYFAGQMYHEHLRIPLNIFPGYKSIIISEGKKVEAQIGSTIS